MLGLILVQAAATGAITLTVTRSKLFSDLRQWTVNRSEFFGELVTCPWCFSHWVSLLVMLASGWHTNFFIQVMAVVAIAAPIQWLAMQSISGLGQAKEHRYDDE